MSIVRENLMKDKRYRPYCGADYCGGAYPRTVFMGDQFKCFGCGWRSQFPDEFIAEYKAKWYESEDGNQKA